MINQSRGEGRGYDKFVFQFLPYKTGRLQVVEQPVSLTHEIMHPGKPSLKASNRLGLARPQVG